ncbi:MAG: glycine cleavage system protein H [Desulfovibrio sp.]|jgi:uncharacterized protein YbaR (Trm112 family)|nr:glycine cleavage system protein H [Desulfovibrio sp.]
MTVNTEELLRILACPRCLGDLTAVLRARDAAGLACKACQVVYPVREDIPIMLVEEAIPAVNWNTDNPDCPLP